MNISHQEITPNELCLLFYRLPLVNLLLTNDVWNLIGEYFLRKEVKSDTFCKCFLFIFCSVLPRRRDFRIHVKGKWT